MKEMNVLFLTLLSFDSIKEHNIYTDLLREFVKDEHRVYVISPVEKRQEQKTHLIKEENTTILRLQIGNIQKTNIIEKGISTVLIEPLFKNAIRKYFSNVKFDLVLYATPPITLVSAIKYVKKRDGARTYLMLKDIFPQNAVDLDMFKKDSLIYRIFRRKEKILYDISDYIGCTSPENIRFIKRNNPELDNSKLEICVNCMEPNEEIPNKQIIKEIRKKYSIPSDKKIFLYGGNLGKPQGVDFFIKCLKNTEDIKDVFFLIVGAGTEKRKLEEYIMTQHPRNVKLMNYLPKIEFERLTSACDVGMIFLNYNSTTPNTPSRLLSYTNAGIPVLAVTDPCTDVGRIIEDGRFGWHCLSNNVNDYRNMINKILETSNWDELRKNSREYLLNNYSPKFAYRSVIRHMEEYL